MSFSFNVKPNPPTLFPSALQSGRKANAKAGLTNHVYSGQNLGNLTGIFLSGKDFDKSNLLDAPGGYFGINTGQNVFLTSDFLAFNTPNLAAGTYSLKVSDVFGKSSEIPAALRILDNSAVTLLGFDFSDSAEIIGDDQLFTGAAELNSAYSGLEHVFEDFTAVAGSAGQVCLKTLDLFDGYSDNIGSSTFRLVRLKNDDPMVEHPETDYGNLTVHDVTTKGGVDFCWNVSNYSPHPILYRISFVSGNYSPNSGVGFSVGLFTLTKK